VTKTLLNWIDADKIDTTNGSCVLQLVAVCCSVLLSTLPTVRVCCSVLQCVAVCCSVLLVTNINEVALFLNWIDADKIDTTNGTCVLQCVAVCCSVLQCAIHCI